MDIAWEDGFQITVEHDADSNVVLIEANRSGLLSLAKQLIALADETPGSHIHYDEFNSLEEGSSELIIGKV
jgi:hypothetical protein